MVNKHVLRLNLLGLGLVVFVVILGAFTRLVDAGLGCPDWPGCYGHLKWPDTVEEVVIAEQAFPDAPVDHAKTWPEMVHRYFAGALLLVVVALTLFAWRNNPANKIREISTALLILIICQAAFGAWTVTLKLWPQVVTAHLLGGFATFSLLWVLYLRQGGARTMWLERDQRSPLLTHARIAFAVVIAQIALGGWVSSNYAALACADFPTCYGSFNPPMDFAEGFNVFQHVGPNYLGGLLDSDARVAIHWSHRIGAVLVLFIVGALAWRLWSKNRFVATMMATLLALQICLGILNVVWSLPLGIATAHNAFGVLLLLALVTVNFAPAVDASTPQART